ncbi:MAG: hypothetical protein ACNA8W_09385, partial [Bradymonadaceae bacterium]
MADDKLSSKRKVVGGANAVVIIVVTIAIAIVANAISSQVFARFDLTENKIYTLSDASKEAVRDLDETVEARLRDADWVFHHLGHPQWRLARFMASFDT